MRNEIWQLKRFIIHRQLALGGRQHFWVRHDEEVTTNLPMKTFMGMCLSILFGTVAGDAFVLLMPMTVLPYIMVSLIVGRRPYLSRERPDHRRPL